MRQIFSYNVPGIGLLPGYTVKYRELDQNELIKPGDFMKWCDMWVDVHPESEFIGKTAKETGEVWAKLLPIE